MKLSALSVILAINQAIAVPTLVQRDATPIVNVLDGVDAQVNALNQDVTATPLDFSAITSQANTLLSTIQAGIATVQTQPNLTLTDALSLTTPTQTLAADTNTTIGNLIAIKAQIVGQGLGCTTLQSLQAQYLASTQLSDAITALVPAAVQSIAASLSAEISTAIQNGIDAYQGACSSSTTAQSPTSPTSTTAGQTTSTCPSAPTVTITNVSVSTAPAKTVTVTTVSVSASPPRTVTITSPPKTVTITSPARTVTITDTTTTTITSPANGGHCKPRKTVTVTHTKIEHKPCPTHRWPWDWNRHDNGHGRGHGNDWWPWGWNEHENGHGRGRGNDGGH